MARTLTYTLRFDGEAVALGPGRLWAECRSPGGILGSDGAVCRREVRVEDDGSCSYAGEIRFGNRDALTFRALGIIGAGPEPNLRHGTALCEVTGGRGRLAGATGSIASQFLLADGGSLTDHQLGLLFLKEVQ